MYLLRPLSPLLLVGALSSGIFANPEVKADEYDYIVIGGGVGGSVVASRLSEDSSNRVLLIEAGPDNTGITNSIIPFLCNRMLLANANPDSPGTAYNWNYSTTPQQGLANRQIPYPQGRLLGGTSSSHYMYYARGSEEDHNRVAKIVGDNGWGWDALQKYFLKNENFTSPSDGHNTTGEYNPRFHNLRGNGEISVSMPSAKQALDDMILESAHANGAEHPYVLDINAGNSLGTGYMPLSIDSTGKRSSAATAYLSPAVRNRTNLSIFLGSQATRVFQTGVVKGKPAFNQVEFFRNGTFQNATAKRELILSAGAINTPHILLNSGIGDKQALAAVGVKSIVDLPSVGQNMSDHTMALAYWYVNSTNTLDPVFRNDPNSSAEALSEQWLANGTGRFAESALGNLVIFSRLPEDSSVWNIRKEDPSAGPNSPHYEIIPVNGLIGRVLPDQGNYMTTININLNPISKGSITINSTDPLAPPLVDAGLLADPEGFDIAIVREAVKSAKRYFSGPAWDGYVLGPFDPITSAETDDQLTDAIRENGLTFTHPVATASMSPKGASWGVVDPDLKVKGVSGLRIVDASVIPKIPTAHLQGAIYAVAERAVDLIKQG
ncbi:aryl-alcohol oxidase-like protein [Marasmius fiardii PR-910]|nr:aryl-alcohol oxidase-like protein [Marasmius fiardii PR-910]